MFSNLTTISECIIIIIHNVFSTPFKCILSFYTFKNKIRQLHLCIPTGDGYYLGMLTELNVQMIQTF